MTELPDDPRSRVVHRSGELLVTGATGLLGRAVCAALAARGERFRALVRVSSDRDRLAGTGAWLCEGDLLRRHSLDGPLKDVSTVLHLAGVVRSKDAVRNRAVHVEGTRNLLDAARAAGVRRLVAISSDTVLRERRSPYAESKREMEGLLRAAEGIEVVILRPPMMLGPGSPHLRGLLQAAKLPVVPLPGGAGRRRPVDVDDVAAAVLAAMDLPAERVPAGPIDLPGAERLSFGELIRATARAGGRPPPRILEVPARLLRTAAGLLQSIHPDPPLNTERLDGLAEEPAVDGRLAEELLGWKPRGVEDALRRALGSASYSSSSDQNPT